MSEEFRSGPVLPSQGGAVMSVRRRFWTELGFGVFSAELLLLTAVWPDWIEATLGVDPDGGNGSLEWAIVAVLVISATVTPLMARAEWHRARLARADEVTDV